MEQEKSAGAVVFRVQEGINIFLLLHYQEKHWDFPKGHIEQGEKEQETVKREVLEETGIGKIEIINGFKEKINYKYQLKGSLMDKEVVFYLAKTDIKEVRLSFEHIGFEWLPYEDALERLTFDNAKYILKKADKFLKKYGLFSK